MRKRILSMFIVAMALFVLAACGTKTYKVTFDSDGGSAVAAVKVEEGKKVTEPDEPTKDDFAFVEWQLDGVAYDFDAKVTKDITLKAKWEAADAVEPEVTYKVTFDAAGGSAVDAVDVVEDTAVAVPKEPTKEGFVFVEWRLDDEAYDFSKKVTDDVTLVAAWGYEVAFSLGFTGGPTITKKVVEGEKVVAPKVSREGFALDKWEDADEKKYDFDALVEESFKLTAIWTENKDYTALVSLDLPLKVHEDLVLNANFDWTSADSGLINVEVTKDENDKVVKVVGQVIRPETDGFHVVKLSAKKGELTRDFWITVLAHDVDEDAIYSAAFSEIITLNPLMSTGSADSDVYDYLVDYLYGSDYDWEDAMENGYADFPGDFSKIKSDRNPNGEVDMPSIKMKRTLSMAAKYPYSVNHGTDNVVEGSYGVLLDQEKAKETFDNEWVIYLRDDLRFEDGTKINADTYEYSFKQYLNPKLNNARANYLYDSDYINLVNAKKYYDEVEGITWDDVGFEKLSDLSFKITLATRQTQYHVMTYLGIINLVHRIQFELGFNNTGTENFYGSVQVPLISYGQFKLENNYFDTNKFKFNRDDNNYAAWNYTFKEIHGPIIKDQNQVILEFKNGNLDIAGVGGEFWTEFMEDENLYVAPSNSFYRIAISLDRGEDAARPSAPILAYDDFRRALYLATDREDFANNVQPPSQGALGFLSNIHQVSEWATQAYAASDIFKSQLEELGLNPDEGGYNLEEAKQLFDAARAEAIADGKYAASEKVVVQFSYYDAGSNIRIANWVKAQYEKVFNDEGEDIFEIELKPLSSAELNKQRDAGDFDLVFTGMSGATFQATFGMGYIFSPSFSTFLVGRGHDVPDLEVVAEISNLFDIVKAKAEAERTDSEQYLYEELKETNGEFSGTFDELFLLWNNVEEFSADYEGQEEDLHHITAALERALLKQMIAVPLFSSTSAAVLGEHVVRIPHAYSLFLGWGGMYYMYKTPVAR